MSRDVIELLTPRILVVDDESQIHASIRLRLGQMYELVSCFDAHEALQKLSTDRFDLCFADIHMPGMDGFAFIDAARKQDPGLGYVVLSAFDSDENLRRTIPLQVYDFISKPLPEREGFEARIPQWIHETRQRRREHELALQASSIANDLDFARLERDVELIASESARDALLQSASLLTTIHAHLVSASSSLAARARADASLAHLLRNLDEARRTADAAVSVTAGFFDSAYGSRDTSPAYVNEGVRDAISIAARMSHAEMSNKAIDFRPVDMRLSLRGLSGINFLLMMVPAIGIALSETAPSTTVGIHGEHCARLDGVSKDPRCRNFLWVNRRNVLGSHGGVLITITASAASLGRPQIESWLKSEYPPLASLTPRGLLAGVQACHGLLGFSVAPQADQFRLALALPV